MILKFQLPLQFNPNKLSVTLRFHKYLENTDILAVNVYNLKLILKQKINTQKVQKRLQIFKNM